MEALNLDFFFLVAKDVLSPVIFLYFKLQKNLQHSLWLICNALVYFYICLFVSQSIFVYAVRLDCSLVSLLDKCSPFTL